MRRFVGTLLQTIALARLWALLVVMVAMDTVDEAAAAKIG